MPGELLEELKQLASRDRIGYQTYIKFVLSQHVRKMREEKPDVHK
jgi:predicted DNA binding CopG/RHH family protein